MGVCTLKFWLTFWFLRYTKGDYNETKSTGPRCIWQQILVKVLVSFKFIDWCETVAYIVKSTAEVEVFI